MLHDHTPPYLPAAPGAAFSHEALLYDSDGSFLAGTVPYIREGLDAGEPVLVAVSAERIDLLSDVLGSDADAVGFADMAQMGANPARILPAWHAFLEERGESGKRIRGIGEPIWADRTADELTECQLHEALLNVAFAGADGFRLLCPYDVGALGAAVVREARCSHPVVFDGADRSESASYRGRDGVPPQSEAPLAPPPAGARSLSFDADTLGEVRDLVAACGEAAGLDERRAGELVLAVHELATNSVLHGGGIGVARAWHEDATAICEVRDRGRFGDLLAGRRRPRPDQLGGWGLWIANHACDLVQIRTTANGTTVRARMRAH